MLKRKQNLHTQGGPTVVRSKILINPQNLFRRTTVGPLIIVNKRPIAKTSTLDGCFLFENGLKILLRSIYVSPNTYEIFSNEIVFF